MNLGFCSFASSSKGNCFIIKSETTTILMDTGITAKSLDQNLLRLNVDYENINAIVITHEHSDHTKSLHTIVRKRPWKGIVYATAGTKQKVMEKTTALLDEDFRVVHGGQNFFVGDIKVSVFRLSHDGIEPVGYTFECGGKKISIVTDTGNITDEIFQSIRGADILVIEANHEKNILLYGRYTYALKCRILSDIGHLSNEACGNCICSYLKDINGIKTPTVILAHLSQENNTPQQAFLTVKNILEEQEFFPGKDLILEVAQKDLPGKYIEV